MLVNVNHLLLDHAWIPDLPSLSPVSLSRDSVVVDVAAQMKKPYLNSPKRPHIANILNIKRFIIYCSISERCRTLVKVVRLKADEFCSSLYLLSYLETAGL